MMLAGPSLRTVPMTVHCALSQVPKLLTVGLSYRSPIKFSFEGNADFQNVPQEFERRLVE